MTRLSEYHVTDMFSKPHWPNEQFTEEVESFTLVIGLWQQPEMWQREVVVNFISVNEAFSVFKYVVIEVISWLVIQGTVNSGEIVTILYLNSEYQSPYRCLSMLAYFVIVALLYFDYLHYCKASKIKKCLIS